MIVSLGAILALLLWTLVSRDLEIKVERQTQWYASALAHVVETEVQRLDSLLRRRAQIWTADPFTKDLSVWREDAGSLLTDHPALVALLRVRADSNWEMAGPDEGTAILREILPEVRRREVDADSDWIIGPLRTASGSNVLAIQVRATKEGKQASTVVAVVTTDRLLADLLETRAAGYAITVRAGSEDLYRRGPAEGVEQSALVRSERIALPGGDTWTIEVVPIREAWAVAGSQRGSLIALAGGFVASALIAAAVHFGTLSWRRERILRQTNTVLQHQIEDTRRGEHELKALSLQLEARVEERTAELNETIVELETFNYSVSHDLRGPLGAVINFAAILGEDYGDRLDDTGRDHLRRIVGSASAAVSMMDALLAYSRSGRAELHKSYLDMARVAREVADELSVASPQLRCCVHIGDLPPAYADESMMRMVFANLLGNACKFVRDGGSPHVEVGGAAGSGEVTYWVRDQGLGFDMRYADKLFKVFERLHPRGQHAGHGVGLAIVARIVRRHGGRVWAQSAPDKGATFYFTVASEEA